MNQTTMPARVSRGLRPFLSGDPLKVLRDEMEDLLSRFTPGGTQEWLTGAVCPSMDVSETADAVQVKIDLPGLKTEDIQIEVADHTLRVTGERKEEKEEKGKSYHRVERHVGKFTRAVTLPCAVKEDKVQAEYQGGVVTITLPKEEGAKAHRIKVAAK